MRYGLNDKPGWLPWLLYGLQWWIVSLPCVMILGIIVAKLHFEDMGAQIFYIQKLFGVMGITMMVQVLWGHRLPLVIGPASVLLIGVLAALSAGTGAIYTAILTGGVLLMLLAFTGWLSKLQFIFTPRIIVVILCLIAFTLSPVILKLIFAEPGRVLLHLFFALGLVLVMTVANQGLPGIWKSTVVLLALVAGSLGYFLLTDFPVLPPLEAAVKPDFFNFPLDFDAGTILAFVFCFLALLINELGSVQAVGGMLGADKLGKRTTRGVGVTGVANVVSGLLGVVGPVDYSMSPGIIAATGCGSRYTLIPAGLGLLACAFLPGFVCLLNAVPGVVMGAVLLYLMSSQLSAGVQMLARESVVPDFNSGLTVGLPLMVALMLSFAPAEAIGHIPAMIRPIVGNGFVMGVISVLLLEHGIFRRPKAQKRDS